MKSVWFSMKSQARLETTPLLGKRVWSPVRYQLHGFLWTAVIASNLGLLRKEAWIRGKTIVVNSHLPLVKGMAKLIYFTWLNYWNQKIRLLDSWNPAGNLFNESKSRTLETPVAGPSICSPCSWTHQCLHLGGHPSQKTKPIQPSYMYR